MARPKLKDKQINVRLPQTLRTQVEEVAELLGMGNSEYIRMLIVQDMEKRRKSH